MLGLFETLGNKAQLHGQNQHNPPEITQFRVNSPSLFRAALNMSFALFCEKKPENMEMEWISLKRGYVIVRLRKGFAYN